MYIIVGLGNPGRDYQTTRHNIGFLAVDRLAEKLGIGINKNKFKALVGSGIVSGQKVMLVKPQTYMNNSGQALREILSFYKIKPENMLVIYDDIDIPLGAMRIRKKGSSGTHNGMKSIIYQLQTDDFPRIRIGTGRDDNMDLVDFVLGSFSDEEKDEVDRILDQAVEAALCWMEKGIDLAMNRYNTTKKLIREKKAKKEDAEKR
jgi:PTH1 family peptidyl-tRNA hydrolase